MIDLFVNTILISFGLIFFLTGPLLIMLLGETPPVTPRWQCCLFTGLLIGFVGSVCAIMISLVVLVISGAFEALLRGPDVATLLVIAFILGGLAASSCRGR
jgi:hypothetical protein